MASQLWYVGEHGKRKQLTMIDRLPPNIQIINIETGKDGDTYIICNDGSMIVIGKNEFRKLMIINEVIKMITNNWYQHRFIDNDTVKVICLFANNLKYEQEAPILMTNYGNIKYISHGIYSQHRFIITQCNNELYGVGYNGANELGISFNFCNQSDFTKITYFKKKRIDLEEICHGDTYTLYLSKHGQIYVSGKNKNGALGLGLEWEELDGIRKVMTLRTKICSIACGMQHNLALATDGDVYQWGNTNINHKWIWKPTLITYLIENGIKIILIKCGSFHNVLLDSDKNMYTFGHNDDYQCGLKHCEFVKEPTLNKTINDIKTIHCGHKHNVIKTINNNEYWLWGNNQYKQCLVFNTHNFVKVPTKYECGDFTEKYDIVSIYCGWNETRIVTKHK